MMLLLKNLGLALLWAGLTGSVSLGTLFFGFLVGFGVLAVLHNDAASRPYFRTTRKVVGFALFFLKELIVSSFRVAYDVVTPRDYARPGVIGIPLDARTDLEITLFANILSLTPGTLSLDVSADRRTLYIHAMFIDDPDVLRREIKEGLEHRLLDLMRGGA